VTRARRQGGTPAQASPASFAPPGPGAAAGALPAIATALALAAVFVLALQPLWATDLGWQLRLGRDLLARGVPAGIPHADTLSWSAPGAPWIELRWLWALGLALVERAGGYAAISFASAALVTLAFALAAASALGRDARAAWTAPVTLAAALASQQRFLARPETFTFVAVAAFLLVLHRGVPRRPGARWLLPALQVVWVNAHTLFALGPVLVAAWVAAGLLERRGTFRRDAGLLAAVLAACLVNPYGFGALSFAWLVWTELHAPIVRGAIRELAGPFAIAGDFTNLRWFTGLLAAVPLVALAVWARRRRLDAFLALATGLGLGLALASVRNLPLFAIPAVPFLVHHLAVVFPAGARAGRFARIAAPLAGAALALVTLADVPGGGFYARQGDPRTFGAGLAPARYPVGAAAILRDLGIEDRVFSTFHESSWLLAEGQRSYLDPRIEVFGAERLETYLRAQADPAAWARLAQVARPRAVVAGLDGLRFAEVLDGTGWRLAGFDAVAAVYLPPDATPADRALERSVERLAPAVLPRPAADRLGAFLLARGRPDLARDYLAGARDPRARLNRARALEETGDEAGAGREREAVSQVAPHDPAVATERALDLLAAGRAAEAAALLDPVLEHEDAPARAWALRGEAYGAQGRLAEAESCLARAAALAPDDANIRRRLAAVRTSRTGR
jgi:tetratricopeptide (TPR) repeat protein